MDPSRPASRGRSAVRPTTPGRQVVHSGHGGGFTEQGGRVSGCGMAEFNGDYVPDGSEGGALRFRKFEGGNQCAQTINRTGGGKWWMCHDHSGSWYKQQQYTEDQKKELPPGSGWEVGDEGSGSPPTLGPPPASDARKRSEPSESEPESERGTAHGGDIAVSGAESHIDSNGVYTPAGTRNGRTCYSKKDGSDGGIYFDGSHWKICYKGSGTSPDGWNYSQKPLDSDPKCSNPPLGSWSKSRATNETSRDYSSLKLERADGAAPSPPVIQATATAAVPEVIRISGAGHALTNGEYRLGTVELNGRPFWLKTEGKGCISFRPDQRCPGGGVWRTNKDGETFGWEYFGEGSALPPEGTWPKLPKTETGVGEPGRAADPRPTLVYGGAAALKYKKRSDFSNDEEYTKYMSATLKVGMRVRALGGYLVAGDTGTYTRDDGSECPEFTWDKKGVLFENIYLVEIIDEERSTSKPVVSCKKRSDFSNDEEYTEYMSATLKVGMRVRALNSFGCDSAGDTGTYTRDDGSDCPQFTWDKNGVLFSNLFNVEIIDEESTSKPVVTTKSIGEASIEWKVARSTGEVSALCRGKLDAAARNISEGEYFKPNGEQQGIFTGRMKAPRSDSGDACSIAGEWEMFDEEKDMTFGYAWQHEPGTTTFQGEQSTVNGEKVSTAYAVEGTLCTPTLHPEDELILGASTDTFGWFNESEEDGCGDCLSICGTPSPMDGIITAYGIFLQSMPNDEEKKGAAVETIEVHVYDMSGDTGTLRGLAVVSVPRRIHEPQHVTLSTPLVIQKGQYVALCNPKGQLNCRDSAHVFSMWYRTAGSRHRLARIVGNTVGVSTFKHAIGWNVTISRASPAAAEDETPAEVAMRIASTQASKDWMRSKIMLVGQGRAGKSALARSIIGQPFENTASTIGIDQLMCEVKYASTGSEGGQWVEHVKAEREFEAALAALVASGQDDAPAAATVVALMKKKSMDHRPQPSPVPSPIQIKKLPQKEKSPKPAAVAATESQSPSPSPNPIVEIAPAAAASAANPRPDDHTAAATTTTAIVAAVAPTTAAASPHHEESKVTIDEELLMKCLATAAETASSLIISVFDYGGQPVFDVIHQLFLSPCGVYVLAFNMEWLLDENSREHGECLEFLRFWLNSIVVHTWSNEERCAAPIVLVGTRKDIVSAPARHEDISTVLCKNFETSLAWLSHLDNDQGVGANGRARLAFFPVDNTQGRGDPTMLQLMSTIEGAMEKASYTHTRVPLTWLRTVDALVALKRPSLTRNEATVAAASCGVVADEVQYLLRFLNDMGVLLWLDEPSLSDIIVMDPVAFLVTPFTIINCNLTAVSNQDHTRHVLPVHAECERWHRKEWKKLIQQGILSSNLLPVLWKDFANQEEILKLLVKFGLLVWLDQRDDDDESEASDDRDSAVESYLVPALLQNAPAKFDWTKLRFNTCFFIFTAGPDTELEDLTTIHQSDCAQDGFMPGGLFSRVIGKAVTWSQITTGTGSSAQRDGRNKPVLYKDAVVLSFGNQRFRLTKQQGLHAIRLDVCGVTPLAVLNRVSTQIETIVKECMPSLRFFVAVNCGDLAESFTLTPLRKVVNALQRQHQGGGDMDSSMQKLKTTAAAWIKSSEPLSLYDVMISYRQGVEDETMAQAMDDCFTRFTVGENARAIETFLGRQRLLAGQRFDVVVSTAICKSLVVVPIISVDSLTHMMGHNPKGVDYVLMEWLIALEAVKSEESRLEAIHPVLVGGSQAGFEDIKMSIPSTVPTATLAQAAERLRENAIEPSNDFAKQTVVDVVEDMVKFGLFESWTVRPERVMSASVASTLSALQNCKELRQLTDDEARYLHPELMNELVSANKLADASDNSTWRVFFVKREVFLEENDEPLMEFRNLFDGGNLILETFDLRSLLRGILEHYRIISHRWETKPHPDPKASKRKKLREYLRKHSEVRGIWLDYCCLPQGNRSPAERTFMGTSLANVNVLYLTQRCVVFADQQYTGRFWTQYELYCATRRIAKDGFEPATAAINSTLPNMGFERCEIVEMGAGEFGNGKLTLLLLETWGFRSRGEACQILAQDDVDVTCSRDKPLLLAKLEALEKMFIDMFVRDRTLIPPAVSHQAAAEPTVAAVAAPAASSPSTASSPSPTKLRPVKDIVNDIKEEMGIDDASMTMREALCEAIDQLGISTEGNVKEMAIRAAEELSIPVQTEI